MSLNLDRSTWRRVKFGEVVRHVTDKVDPDKAGIERYLAGEHIDSERLHVTKWGTVGDGYLGPAFYKRFTPGQVLYVSRRTYLKKVAVPLFEGICGEKTFVLEPCLSDLRADFLPVLMTSEAFHRYTVKNSRGSVNPYLNWTDLAQFTFELPLLDEQERIASLFWAIEMERRQAVALEKALALTLRVERKESMSRGHAYRADQCFDVAIGRQRSPNKSAGGSPRPYLRAANVKDGLLLLDDVKTMRFTDSEAETYALRRDDVVVTEGCGSPQQIGAAARVPATGVPKDCCFQNTLLRYRSVPGVTTPAFLYHWARFAFAEGHFRSAASGTGILHIGLERARAMEVKVPSLDAQESVVEGLDSLEHAIAEAASRSAAAANLLAGLANEVAR